MVEAYQIWIGNSKSRGGDSLLLVRFKVLGTCTTYLLQLKKEGCLLFYLQQKLPYSIC